MAPDAPCGTSTPLIAVCLPAHHNLADCLHAVVDADLEADARLHPLWAEDPPAKDLSPFESLARKVLPKEEATNDFSCHVTEGAGKTWDVAVDRKWGTLADVRRALRPKQDFCFISDGAMIPRFEERFLRCAVLFRAGIAIAFA
eukprot:EG_transcript_25762